MARWQLTRRGFLQASAAGAGAAGLGGCAKAASARFTHGVASGDPLTDRVIVWTRVVPDAQGEPVPVRWQIAEDEAFERIVSNGETAADPARDYTVKVDAGGLSAGRAYFYRFLTEGQTSPVGRTRTLPEGSVDQVRFAVCSCSNYPQGYFTAYREMAKEPDIDAVLHLGDYFYEYEDGRYSDPEIVAAGRAVDPANEIVSLEDYRRRYALYRSDPDLQAVHAAHPWIAVWDDHEIANDTYKNGAENHQPEQEGPFAERRAAAIQAWREWMPVRDPANGPGDKIYRRFDFGDLASLIMLDTRLIGRDMQLSYTTDMVYRTQAFDFSDPANPVAITDPARVAKLPAGAVRELPLPFQMTEQGPQPILDFQRIREIDPDNLPEGVIFLPDADRFRSEVLGREERSILGDTQEQWVADQFAAADRPWQIIGQQLLLGRVKPPALQPEQLDPDKPSLVRADQLQFFNLLNQVGLPFNLDAWDGYPAARERFYRSAQGAENVIVLAGDTHNGWVFNLADETGAPVGVEFATPSISSPGIESYVPADPDVMETLLVQTNEELTYMNAQDRGYLVLTVTPEEARSRFQFVSTVKAQDYEPVEGPTFTVRRGDKRVS
ncbi:MAG: alkaline phosphatase D family protein [Rhodothalassiaceae bacterium]